jgi:hypothetical protein
MYLHNMSDAEVVTILCERRILTSQEELKQPSLSLSHMSRKDGMGGQNGRLGTGRTCSLRLDRLGPLTCQLEVRVCAVCVCVCFRVGTG